MQRCSFSLQIAISLSACLLVVFPKNGQSVWISMDTIQSNASSAAAFRDKEALLAIKTHFTADPNGATQNWNPNATSALGWTGVVCSPNGLALRLDLSNRNISGPLFFPRSPLLPRSLRNLRQVNLTGNRFTGPISGGITRLTRILTLDLSRNLLEGSIPPSLGNLSRLTFLDISLNNLSGPIPIEIGYVSNLSTLLLAHNHLSGPIPTLDNLTLLSSLNLSQNNFSGVIPTSGTLGRFPEPSFTGNPALCYHICNPPPPAPPPLPFGHSHMRVFTPGVIVALVICGIGVFVALIFAASFCGAGILDSATSAPPKLTPVKQSAVTIFDSKSIRAADFLEAVGSFEEGAVVGRSTWGVLYRAVFFDRSVCGVLKLNPVDHMRQPLVAFRIATLAKLRHDHVVPLIGQWQHDTCPVLLYEWMPHGTLKEFLHTNDPAITRRSTKWMLRYRIALGTAKGLAFLHHSNSPPIPHGDLNATTVRLDQAYEPRIADVSVSSMMSAEGLVTPSEEGREYTDPAFDNVNGDLLKSDVYSYGILLLEILTGRAPRDSRTGSGRTLDLCLSVKSQIQDGRSKDVLDSKVAIEETMDDVYQLLKIALMCLGDDPVARPSMAEVVDMLVRAQENAQKIKKDPRLRDILS